MTIQLCRLDGTIVEVPGPPKGYLFYPHFNDEVDALVNAEIPNLYPDNDHYHSRQHIASMVDDFREHWHAFKEAYPDDWHENCKDRDRAYGLGLLAVLFHDIVYEVGAEDNEERSAEIAVKSLSGISDISEKELDIIRGHILYTKLVPDEPSMRVSRYIRDLDCYSVADWVFYHHLSMRVSRYIRDLDCYSVADWVFYHHLSMRVSRYIRDLDWLGFADYDTMMENEVAIVKEAMAAGYSSLYIMEGRISFLETVYNSNEPIFKTKVFEEYNTEARENISRRLWELRYGKNGLEALIANDCLMYANQKEKNNAKRKHRSN